MCVWCVVYVCAWCVHGVCKWHVYSYVWGMYVVYSVQCMTGVSVCMCVYMVYVYHGMLYVHGVYMWCIPGVCVLCMCGVCAYVWCICYV